MSDYISREAVEKLLRYCVALERRDKRPCKAEDILMDFYRLPAADVVEVVHGRWMFEGTIENTWKVMTCSACGGQCIDGGAYCPNCGAKMDGGIDK